MFDTLTDAQSYFDDFRAYYNSSHYHFGLNYYTPASVHNGTWPAIQRARQETLNAAFIEHPGWFSRPPIAPAPPAEAWINRPSTTITTTAPEMPIH